MWQLDSPLKEKKKTCLIEQYYRHYFGTAILKKINFILFVGCNNAKKLKVTLKFTLVKL